MPKFDQAFIDGLTGDGRNRFYFDTVLSGFAIRVTASGKKLFVARAMKGGRRRSVTIGPADKLTLAKARARARTALDDLRAGRDPGLAQAEREKAARAGETTIEALATRWMAEIVRLKRKPRTAEDYQRLINQRIVPKFGHMSVAHVAREDVIAWHASMAKTPRRANYALATLKAMLHFAEDVGLRPQHSNPCRRIEMYRENRRERFLSHEEIGKAADAITKAAADGKNGPYATAGLRLALFTGARSGEITAMKWSYLDRDRKMIRLPDSKTNDARTIHLSDAAMEIVASLPRIGPYIIAGAKEGEAYRNLGRAWIKARAYAGLDDVRLHDLRHSYASLAAGRGVSLQMIGKLLGHKHAATTQRYAHLARDAVSEVNDQIGEAMNAAIGKPHKGLNVVKLPRGKRAR